MRVPNGSFLRRAVILIPVAAGLLWTTGLLGVTGAAASTVTFTGTVGYTGIYMGSALYVEVLDTSGGDPTVVASKGFQPGEPPFAQFYSLSFDNTGVSPQVAVVALLDVDGGGKNSVSGADVFGWLRSDPVPTFVSSDTSHTGLDIILPRAEIRGTLTFAPGQTEARVIPSTDAHCAEGYFRPTDPFTSAGAYAIVGLYPGTYCISAEGDSTNGSGVICYGDDPTCKNATTVTIGPTDVLTGIDFDFTATPAPVAHTTWGLLKNRY